MKAKIASITTLGLVLVSFLTMTPAHGAPIATVYGWTDKSSYLPGDSGVLHVTVRDEGTNALTVRNITVTYPWKAFITDHWDGNTTQTNINNAVAAGQNYNTQYSFTVPTDGRVFPAVSQVSTVSIQVGTDIGPNGAYSFGSATITIAQAAYQPLTLTNSILPILTVVLLGIAVVMLALIWMGFNKQKK